MTIIDVIGISSLVLLGLILFVSAFSEIKDYRKLKRDWAIIQHNLSKHGVNLKQDGFKFYYVSLTRKSRNLYPSEVLSFWYHCQATSFEENTLEI